MVDTQQIKLNVCALCSDTSAWVTNKNFKNLTKCEFTEQMKTKYINLYNSSSTLFERCISGDLNTQQLTFMLEMIDKVNGGADYHTTSVEVGQKLVDIYVKPLIENKD